MKKELKGKWVAALRSGEYKQGKFSLCNDAGEHCCLGVLHRVAGVDPLSNDETHVLWNTGWSPQTRELLGKDDAHHLYPLTHQNDRGDSFSKIADYIEENVDASE